MITIEKTHLSSVVYLKFELTKRWEEMQKGLVDKKLDNLIDKIMVVVWFVTFFSYKDTEPFKPVKGH